MLICKILHQKLNKVKYKNNKYKNKVWIDYIIIVVAHLIVNSMHKVWLIRNALLSHKLVVDHIIVSHTKNWIPLIIKNKITIDN